MKLFCLSSAAMHVAIMLTCMAACADEPQEKHRRCAGPRDHTSHRTRDPVNKSYRKDAGTGWLCSRRYMACAAPDASLALSSCPGSATRRCTRIVRRLSGHGHDSGGAGSGSHVHPCATQQALDENAVVMPNRKQVARRGALKSARRVCVRIPGDLEICAWNVMWAWKRA